jgi:hypothetical protein
VRSEFAMSSRAAAVEAADWLEGMGCLAEPGSDDGRDRLVVHHDDARRPDVARMVGLVDPAASEVREA